MIVLALAAAAAAMPIPPSHTAKDARDIRAKCHVPRSWVSFTGGALRLTPPKGASDDKIECILAEATKNFPKDAFIGNEQQ
ncbi:hypothetical protein [Sphingomonas sp.]|uniref:hypothetical protein n=1 Tax=Sphingomonas sp. TaxID=28214 RepID=UPI0025E1006E|nr:hypothetical protein [Sphingomonas sp.]